VGLILGVEMSRLARSNKDWHGLLELCALFGTLIADLNGVYDPAHYSDRLLLGLSGMMSEAELHLLKQRMYQGKLAKAKRGELGFAVPIGYLRRPSGEVVIDPDEEVQEVVRLLFRKFEELGSLHALLRYLVEHDIRLGVRVRNGPAKGELEWRRPNRMTLQNLLRHPIYAGAYVYGLRQVDSKKKRHGRPSSGRSPYNLERCHVLIQDALPAYITWEQYEMHQARLRENRSRMEAKGAVRGGHALLAGLVACGKCGCRMTVRYYTSGYFGYACANRLSNYAERSCQHIAGPSLEAFVVEQVLQALAPAALELSLEATSQLEQERVELDRLWQRWLERARYEAERAGRQYQLVDPENRLVARTLEQAWEEKLSVQQRLEEDYRRFVDGQSRVLTAAEREAVRQLAKDVPALWAASTTGNVERKEILRQLIERVVVNVKGESERVHLDLVWVGGLARQHILVRPVASLEQLSYYPQLRQRVADLLGQGLSSAELAETLNQEGLLPPKRATRYSAQTVPDLIRRLGLRSGPALRALPH
jgi:hypothetical protein